VATVQGIGASTSGLVAGEIVDHFGYSAAFLTSGAAAVIALSVFALAMPETAPAKDRIPTDPHETMVTGAIRR
jgi:sugar phosphate permease